MAVVRGREERSLHREIPWYHRVGKKTPVISTGVSGWYCFYQMVTRERFFNDNPVQTMRWDRLRGRYPASTAIVAVIEQ